jgi:hypothetical protein
LQKGSAIDKRHVFPPLDFYSDDFRHQTVDPSLKQYSKITSAVVSGGSIILMDFSRGTAIPPDPDST